jgi:hypothetical protein
MASSALITPASTAPVRSAARMSVTAADLDHGKIPLSL